MALFCKVCRDASPDTTKLDHTIAFLSFFVTLVGTFLWQLVVFFVHQLKANRVKVNKKQNGIWHANMVILRNSGSPISLAWETFRAWLSWRESASDTLGTFVLLVVSLSIAGIIAVASILTAKVRITESPVGLLRSTSCGPWSFSNFASASQKVFNDTVTAANYASVCYYGSSDPNVCSTQFVQTRINWTSTSDVACPFEDSICRASPYRMDTGLLDTRSTLGLNSRDQDRLFYRRITTCAPLHTAGFEQEYTQTVNNGTRDYMYDHWFFGPTNVTNYTWSYNEEAIYDQSGYQLT